MNKYNKSAAQIQAAADAINAETGKGDAVIKSFCLKEANETQS